MVNIGYCIYISLVENGERLEVRNFAYLCPNAFVTRKTKTSFQHLKNGKKKENHFVDSEEMP